MIHRVRIGLQASEELLDVRRLLRLARYVLTAEGVGRCEVGVVLTDDRSIQELNLRYRGQDRPTDVLAFGMREESEGRPDLVLPEGAWPYLGDVAVSVERAQAQAADYAHPWQRELELLLVHGLLHLLGYNDEGEEERSRMQARQERLLHSFEARRSLGESIAVAFSGLADLWRSQRNVRIHLVLAVAAAALAVWLGLTPGEWAVLLLTVALVLVTEGINSALEVLVDLASPGVHPLARRAKDLAAAAVLLAALFSLAIGALLFLPRLWELLR